ncbi:uncharacterized protein LOC126977872 [Leptidea sinapis]|uniref:uncharacterized protein LOC126977872 n=1 Tax=Leptidea sinapis TaxID=189913 RepID=UPI0021368DA5|nr:uncharacterized protein LOC126977872 [Leptidea sinapis]
MYLSSISSRLLMHDINSWDLIKSFGNSDALLRDVSWSDDSKYMLQVNSKGSVEVLSPVDNDIRSVQHIPIKESWSASFHREGHRLVAVGTKNGGVVTWDTKNKSVTKSFPLPAQTVPVNFISYNSKNTSIAATLQNGDTIVYSLVSNVPVLNVKLNCSKNISAMKFHHESQSVLGLATDEGHVVIRDVIVNKDRGYYENVHASPVSDFSFSPINKDVMLTCGYDKIIHIYDIRLQIVVSTIKTSFALTSLTMNGDNKVALGTKSGHVLVYDMRDYTCPYKVLNEHDEEVTRVVYQPSRRKTNVIDQSLNEVFECSMKIHSPVRNRSSDMFYADNSLLKKHLDPVTDNKADSFLVNLGLDQSNTDVDVSADFLRNGDKSELRYPQLNTEKNITKTSTPLVNRNVDFAFTSPCVIPNGEPLEVPASQNQDNIIPVPMVDNKAIDELKDFISQKIFDVAYDNKNYFLHVNMALTKQKLYLEKQFSNISAKLESIVQTQNALFEANRNLVLQIEKLKSNNN